MGCLFSGPAELSANQKYSGAMSEKTSKIDIKIAYCNFFSYVANISTQLNENCVAEVFPKLGNVVTVLQFLSTLYGVINSIVDCKYSYNFKIYKYFEYFEIFTI